MSKDFSRGFVCKECGSYVKQYTRSFNANMALCVLLLYKHNVRGFVKVEDFLIKNGQKRCGDFSYLVHYKFLERQSGKREDGSPRNGFYKLTSLGILFAEGKIGAKKKFVILHNQLQGFEGDEIYIKEALGKRFDYSSLMALNSERETVRLSSVPSEDDLQSFWDNYQNEQPPSSYSQSQLF